MATLFIADLHLSSKDPEITDCFFRFLEEKAVSAEALYILGDLFEFWIGDDDPKPLYQEIAQRLFALHQNKLPIYFIHGNRDFMVGEKYAKKAGMTILPETALIDLYGKPTLILHGDTLCINDEAYQNYRKKVNNKKLQWIFNHLPLFIRQKIGDKIRQGSQDNTPKKNQEITNVVQKEVERLMLAHKSLRLIHGHTHKPDIHRFTLNGKDAERIVLGDWYQQGSILVCDEKGCRLETRTFSLPASRSSLHQ